MELTTDSLAFADDIMIFPDFLETAPRQIRQLKTQAGKVGLQICCEKKEFITNITPVPRELEVDMRKMKN